ncbi:glycoside hydrolase family 16 protein [Luteimonas composti]|uniref:Glycoside hydrolase family 16 protein n=1 Tax=Luteimonas composti TaxID=398257 RepID=A0ABT6MMW1_9GAMM|nr:glycoside hydrolase family 16 protein [Luteimonas composti]MDH7451936.1 glycoside hydrolase family 16 protein [Luteimonas composti]
MHRSTPRRRSLLVASLLAMLATAPACASDAGMRRAAAVPAATSRVLVWADEFETIDAASWSFETGGHGWGNQELQYYTDGGNAFIQCDTLAGSRVLVIEARRGAPAGASCWYGACQYSSSRMVTRGRQEFRHGRIEARMRLPQTQGVWPAFWMLGGNFATVGWPLSGEIDIMEHVGSEPTLTHGALHGPGYSGGTTPFTGTHDLGRRVDLDYHVYAVEWDDHGFRWFVDDVQFHAVTRAQVEAHGAWVFDQPFFLLLNVAVGGSWPGSPDSGSQFPQRLYVDWVRVHQDVVLHRRTGSQPLAPGNGTPAAAQAATPAAAASPEARVHRAAQPVPVRRTPAPAQRLREAQR